MALMRINDILREFSENRKEFDGSVSAMLQAGETIMQEWGLSPNDFSIIYKSAYKERYDPKNTDLDLDAQWEKIAEMGANLRSAELKNTTLPLEEIYAFRREAQIYYFHVNTIHDEMSLSEIAEWVERFGKNISFLNEFDRISMSMLQEHGIEAEKAGSIAD